MDCPRCGTPMEGGICPECGFPVIRFARMRRTVRKTTEERLNEDNRIVKKHIDS